MNKLIIEIDPDKYILEKPIYKFDNMLFHEGMILSEKELHMLENWGFTSIDVLEIKEEEIIEGVTDVIDSEIVENLKKVNISKINKLEDLENIEFEIDPSSCKTPDNLYLGDKVEISTSMDMQDIVNSNKEAKNVVENIFNNVSLGREIDALTMKMMVTRKIEEFKLFSKELMKSIFVGNDLNFVYRHSVNVMVMALAIGKKLVYKDNWLAELGIAAMLHDIGMSVIDSSYYLTDKKYSFDDYFEIFKHPIIGIDYLTIKLGSKFGGLVSLGVYQHHERLDGSGYPKGKSGLSISEYAKIIAICDVFEAMTSDRPYRKGVSAVEAFKFIADNSGILFDQKLVYLFYEVLVENNIMPDSDVDSSEIPVNPVLVANSSPYSKWYICNMLREHKIPVFSVMDKRNLLIATERYEPKVILIDDSLTPLKGIDAIQELKAREYTKKIPIVYSSEAGRKYEILQAIKLGIVDYLKKPYSFDFVIERVMKHIV